MASLPHPVSFWKDSIERFWKENGVEAFREIAQALRKICSIVSKHEGISDKTTVGNKLKEAQTALDTARFGRHNHGESRDHGRKLCETKTACSCQGWSMH